MIRLSATDLDQYLYWLEMEDVGPEWLIDRLTTFQPSPAMKAGSAFHEMLEHANVGVIETSRPYGDGYSFAFDCDAEISIPAVRELKIEVEVLPGVVLVGKTDGSNGNCVIDYKLTERLDAERYADSYQWRAYLMLFEASTFEYSVFEGTPDRKNELHYSIKGHHKLTFYAYKGMKADVLLVTRMLADFVKRYNVKEKMR